MGESERGRVVCIAPHLDDAVLSLGGTLHRLAARSVDVSVVTVFAGDPEDAGGPSYWDAQRGDKTAGEAARNRRSEDESACRRLGLRPFWGDFADISYVAPRDPAAITAFLRPFVEAADAILVPGWPLRNADHRYVAAHAVQSFPSAPMAFYAEAPYSTHPVPLVKGLLRGRTDPFMRHLVGGDLSWHRTPLSQDDLAAKRAGLAAYPGEVRSLGYKVVVAKIAEALRYGEGLATPEGTPLPAVLERTVF